MTTTTEQSTGGIGFTGLLALVFITLKLTGHIAWSWWWVLAPLWIPALLALAFIAVFAVGVFVAAAVRWRSVDVKARRIAGGGR
jgi:hypothetical protein